MTKKLDNLYEMDRFLEKHKLPKLTQDFFLFDVWLIYNNIVLISGVQLYDWVNHVHIFKVSFPL